MKTPFALAAGLFITVAIFPLAGEPPAEPQLLRQGEVVSPLPKEILVQTLRISPDGRQIAGVVATGEDRVAIFINGKQSPEYDAIVLDSIHFSPDSRRIAYGARRDGHGIVVVDGVEYPAGETCASGFPIFSPNSAHFLYVAVQPGKAKMCVVMDGRPGAPYDSIMKGSPFFSPDGKRFAYVARDGDGGRIVLDEFAGAKYQNVDAPTFSADGNHLAYVAMTGTSSLLVLDGREVAEASTFLRDSLAFDSPTQVHILSLGRNGVVNRLQVDFPEFPDRRAGR